MMMENRSDNYKQGFTDLNYATRTMGSENKTKQNLGVKTK